MRPDPILGVLHPDLACAIALGLVEDPRVVASLEAVTVHDAAMRPLGTVRDWLSPDDPLDAVTRAYLLARREAGKVTTPRPGQSPWVAASGIKAREQANRRAVEARDRARGLLMERGVLVYARHAGLKVLGDD